jgi:inhibitor of cysteine peptidase
MGIWGAMGIRKGHIRIIGWLTFFSLALSLAACSYMPSKVLEADITYSGKELKIAQYNTLTVKLDSNQSTGYRWLENTGVRDDSVVALADHTYTPPGNAGSKTAGTETWTFTAFSQGQTHIILEYRLPDSEYSTMRTFSVTVTVLPGGD